MDNLNKSEESRQDSPLDTPSAFKADTDMEVGVIEEEGSYIVNVSNTESSENKTIYREMNNITALYMFDFIFKFIVLISIYFGIEDLKKSDKGLNICTFFCILSLLIDVMKCIFTDIFYVNEDESKRSFTILKIFSHLYTLILCLLCCGILFYDAKKIVYLYYYFILGSSLLSSIIFSYYVQDDILQIMVFTLLMAILTAVSLNAPKKENDVFGCFFVMIIQIFYFFCLEFKKTKKQEFLKLGLIAVNITLFVWFSYKGFKQLNTDDLIDIPHAEELPSVVDPIS